ncbi:MAG TPA: hypothetical protein DCE42_28385 [Myxococcales bacterium]|nr:hypothetical protein [Myxococcales bacterium]
MLKQKLGHWPPPDTHLPFVQVNWLPHGPQSALAWQLLGQVGVVSRGEGSGCTEGSPGCVSGVDGSEEGSFPVGSCVDVSGVEGSGLASRPASAIVRSVCPS